MVLSPAERKRRQREKEREEEARLRRQGGDPVSDLYRMPFSEWAQNDVNIDDLIQYTGLAGFELPPFDEERDPHDYVIDRIPAFGDGDLFDGAKGALGRAEATVGILGDTALLLATAINNYKRHEIKARLAELEADENVDRAAAMKEAVRLNKLLEKLDRMVRRSVPEWRVIED